MKTRYRIASWVGITGLLLSPIAIGQSSGIVADYLMTQTQPIGDNNSINRSVLGEFVRDSAGRTRFTLENVILITDPVRGLSWHVDTDRRIAYEYRLDMAAPSPQSDGSDASESWPDELIAPQPNWSDPDSGLVETAELGVQTINGVECSGRRWTHSIPEGALGNANPIEVITEAWVSDSFGFQLPVKIVVRSAISGTRTRELRHVKERSFDSSYFRPDADLEIKELEQHLVEP